MAADKNPAVNKQLVLLHAGIVKMKKVKGNLLKLADEGNFDIIVHGCNCHCTMGAGIARQISDKYPQAYEADKQTTPGDKYKLGTATHAIAKDKNGREFFIINAYTQFGFAITNDDKSKDRFEYEAFQKLLDTWVDSPLAEARFGFPMIGSGLAGGDERRITSMIRAFSKEIAKKGGEVTLVEYVK